MDVLLQTKKYQDKRARQLRFFLMCPWIVGRVSPRPGKRDEVQFPPISAANQLIIVKQPSSEALRLARSLENLETLRSLGVLGPQHGAKQDLLRLFFWGHEFDLLRFQSRRTLASEGANCDCLGHFFQLS